MKTNASERKRSRVEEIQIDNCMNIWRLSCLVLVLCSTLTLTAQAQEKDDEKIIEEDSRVTSVADRQRAVTELLRKADELQSSGHFIEAARTLNRAGRFQIRMSVPKDAVVTFRRALKLLEEQPDNKTHIDNLNGLASGYDYLSQCTKTEPLALQAHDLSRQHNYVAGQAESLRILSDCQNYRDHALALKSAEQSLDLWRSINRKRGMADTYMDISHYQILLYNLVECSKSAEAAIDLYRELGDQEELAGALIYLALVEHRKGAYQNALALYTQVQAMVDEKASPYKMGQIAYGLGDTFLESGMPDVALGKFREGLEFFRITQNDRAVSILYWSLGRAHYLMGNYPLALDNLQIARGQAVSNKDETLIAFCDDYLGRTHNAQNDHAAALGHFRSAIERYSRVKNPMEVARTQALIGHVYEQQGSFPNALENYQRALKTFRTLADRLNESATLYAIGSLALKQDELDTAEDYLRQSIEVTEQMRRVSSSADLMTAFSASVHERYERYVECLMRKNRAHPEQGFAVKAFQTNELARARALAELLRTTQTNLVAGVDPQLAEAEKSLRQSLRVKEDYRVALLGRTYRQEELAALNVETEKLEQQYQQISETIRQRYPSYEQITSPVAWGLSQIQEHIVADDQTVLLEYSLGTDRSYVWAVTRNDIKSYELPTGARINEAAEKVYRLLTTIDPAKSGDELGQATRELGQMILSPVAAELNKDRMIVVADGALHYIPFQILPSPSAGNELLVSTAEIINAPSASVLGQLREETNRRPTPPMVLAAFGDPVFESNYAQRKESSSGEYVASVLPAGSERWQHAVRDIEPTADSVDPSTLQSLFYTTHELANLREVAGPETLMVTSFDATREKLASLDLTKYAILHFATHGVLDPKRPENSGLFLSMVNRDGQGQNGFVGLQDIYALNAPVDLVVLSACRTGLGKDVRGEGLIGLTRGFMYAGASNVVASLWKVDDEATAELMKQFYANMLQRGMTPASALREAQNNIRQRPGWRSPYYWAAFTLQGESNQVIKTAPGKWGPRWLQIALGLSFLLLLAGALWYRRVGAAKRQG